MRRNTRRYLALGGMAALGGLAMLVTVIALLTLVTLPLRSNERQVTVIINGQSRDLTSRARTIADLLSEQRIPLGEGDTVSPALTSRLTNNLTVHVKKARSVTLTIDGQSQVYRTHLTNPAAILESAGLMVGRRDEVIIDGSRTTPERLADWPVPAQHITLRRTVELQIVDDSNEFAIETTSQTVGEALFEGGVTLFLADEVTPDLNAPITPNMTITIHRARPISIVADGVTVETRARGTTIAAALAEAGLTLVGQDYTIPAEDTPLLPGMHVRVIRVSEDFVMEDTTTAYETLWQADSALEIDQRAVRQTGQNGIARTTYRLRFENGIEVSRTEESNEVVQAVRNQVIAYGTNVVLRTVDTPGGPRQYWRRIRMYATSYHPAALGGDNITATGQELTKGIIASDPDIIKYGAEVFVPGYGIGQMADTGPPYRPLWIDLGYDDANWVSWSRWVDVYLLAPVPATIQYLLPQVP